MDDFEITMVEYKDASYGDVNIIREYTFTLYDVKIIKKVIINTILQKYLWYTVGVDHAAEVDKDVKNQIKEMIIKDTKLLRKIKLNKIKKIYDT